MTNDKTCISNSQWVYNLEGYTQFKLEAKKMRLSDYEVLETIGTGSFGRVKLARNKQTGL